MPVEAFVDTNIFVYSVSSHPSEREKRDKARALLGAVDFGTSAQVLGEFFVTATRKIAEPLSERQAVHFIVRLTRLPIVAIDSELVLEAARRLGTKTIYSEDLTHEHSYGSARVINPFRTRQ